MDSTVDNLVQTVFKTVSLVHILRTTFLKNSSGGLLLYPGRRVLSKMLCSDKTRSWKCFQKSRKIYRKTPDFGFIEFFEENYLNLEYAEAIEFKILW